MHKCAQMMHSWNPASQFHQRRIQSSWSSSRRNWAEAACHRRNNSWTMIEKFLDFILNAETSSSSGTTSWRTTRSRSGRCTSPTTAGTPSPCTWDDRDYHRHSTWISRANNSSVIATWPAMRSNSASHWSPMAESWKSEASTNSRKTTISTSTKDTSH